MIPVIVDFGSPLFFKLVVCTSLILSNISGSPKLDLMGICSHLEPFLARRSPISAHILVVSKLVPWLIKRLLNTSKDILSWICLSLSACLVVHDNLMFCVLVKNETWSTLIS